MNKGNVFTYKENVITVDNLSGDLPKVTLALLHEVKHQIPTNFPHFQFQYVLPMVSD